MKMIYLTLEWTYTRWVHVLSQSGLYLAPIEMAILRSEDR